MSYEPRPYSRPSCDPRDERVGHAAEPDRVQVRVQEQRTAAAGPARARDHVRPARRSLVELDLEAGMLRPLGHECRDLGLPAAAEPGVDRLDRDQPLEQREDVHPGEPILGTLPAPASARPLPVASV